MKIAVAGVVTKKINVHPLGGTEAFTYLLVDGLVNKGHDVTLYCAKESKTNATRQIEVCNSEEAMGTESNVEFVYPYTLLEIKKILEDLKREKFDLIHVSFLKTFMISFFADQIKIPLLHTIHRDFFTNRRIFEVYKRIGFHKNEYYCFVSKKALDTSLVKHNTFVVYNGINVNNYPFSLNYENKFLWLSRIDPLKGPEEAIRAAKETNVRLILSGDIDRQKYKEYFDAKIKPLLCEHIVYEPFSSFERKVELYQQARAFVFPIQWEEPFGLVVTEALSCGTPVITFDRGAMPEIIKDGVNGFIVPKERGVKGISEAINKLNSLSKSDYEKMRLNCRKIAETEFSVERMIEDYEKLYKQILTK